MEARVGHPGPSRLAPLFSGAHRMNLIGMRHPSADVVCTCRGCGCDDDHACTTITGPCTLVLLEIDMPTGICSRCATAMDWSQRLLATVWNLDAGDDEEAAA
jgi:hypothetical protein